MNSELIPSNLQQALMLTDAERKEFRSKRFELLSELRCVTGLPGLVSNLNQDTVYRLVLKPEGAKLFQDANGNLKGVFYKDGRIVEHAKFQEVGPSLFKAAKVVGMQVLLVSIAMQLNRIETLVGKLFEEFHGDRLAEIEAGKSLFRQACAMQDPEKRSLLILKAIVELTRGFEKTVSALSRQIRELPEEKLSFFDNWTGNKSRKAQESLRLATESLSACLHGVQYLARCYLFLNERALALSIVDEWLSRIESAGAELAYRRARLAPRINDAYPEFAWKQFIDNRKALDANAFAKLACPVKDRVRIEFKPLELMEISHEKL